MDRKLFKLKTAGLVVLGLFLMVGVATLTFAFKAETVAKIRIDNTRQWYVLTGTDSTYPTDQDITGYSGVPDEMSETECAQLFNSGEFCAVYLEFDNEDPAPDLTGKTVQEAIDDNGADIVTGVASSGYSRLPEAN
jgi:hypothetical protein